MSLNPPQPTAPDVVNMKRDPGHVNGTCFITSTEKSPAKLGRVERQCLLYFDPKQLPPYGEDERILFPEKETKNTKRWGVKNLCRRSFEDTKRSRPQLECPPARRARPRRSREGLQGCFLFFFWFCFLSRNKQVGEGVLRNTIWYSTVQLEKG